MQNAFIGGLAKPHFGQAIVVPGAGAENPGFGAGGGGTGGTHTIGGGIEAYSCIRPFDSRSFVFE